MHDHDAVAYAPGLPRIQAGPSVRQMLSLWLPLAASLVMMVLEPSTINVGLGRTTNPELALAAYGVAFSLALLIEAPIIMLLDASVARSTSRQAFAVVRRLTLILGLAVTGLGLLVSLTPLYGLIVVDLMRIPADVAARAQPTLQILSFWPLPIGWRRTHQGVLIRAGKTRVITLATGARLLTLAGGLFAGLLLRPDRGAIVAGLAMVLSVTVEAVLITWATRPVLSGDDYVEPGGDPSSLTVATLWRFYWPLLTTTVMRQGIRPILNAGVATALLPRASLAAWPVAWGFAILVAGPAWSLQQLTTALAVDRDAYARVRNFSLALSLVFSLLLGLVAFTPLYGLVMGGLYNLPTELQDLARLATQLMVLLPLMYGAQSVLRGALIRGGCTGVVNQAMMIDVAVLIAAVVAAIPLLSPSGVTLAAVATLAGGLAELAWLYHKSAC